MKSKTDVGSAGNAARFCLLQYYEQCYNSFNTTSTLSYSNLVTSNPDFKVRPFFEAEYLQNG